MTMLESICLETLSAAAGNLPKYIATVCLMMALFFCIRSYWPWGYKNARAPLPPGPWGIPLLGNLAILRKGFYCGECIELARKYGPVFSREVALRLETGKSDANRHFIDGYLTLITQHLGQPDLNINIDTLHRNMLDFFVAGTTSSAATMLCIIYHCANQPDTLQAKIYGEIERVVGSCNTPTWEDHQAMPYTMAVIWEMQRWKTLNPFNLPRLAEEDVSLNGYRIPKGTVVLANFWAVHFDPKYWKNPEEFDPSRFLTHDESALLSKPEYLLTFSIGKRMCPGELLAAVEVFLCVTTLLQKFRVLPEEGTSFSVATDHYTDLLAKRLCFLSRLPE